MATSSLSHTGLLKLLATAISSLFLRRPISTDATPIIVETSVPFTAHRCEAPSRSVETTAQELVGFFRIMALMRRMEIAADSLYKAKLIRGFCHLYDGQEAVAIGMEAPTSATSFASSSSGVRLPQTVRKSSKSKRMHSVPSPPPPPSRPEPRRRSPLAVDPKPPLPAKLAVHQLGSRARSLLIPMLLPPPPPFRVPELRFATSEDFVRSRNAHGTRCSSPELSELEYEDVPSLPGMRRRRTAEIGAAWWGGPWWAAIASPVVASMIFCWLRYRVSRERRELALSWLL